MELWLNCVSVAVLAVNILRMVYRLRMGSLVKATVIDWILLTLFAAVVFIAIPYCFLKCIGQSHDFWHIIPPFSRR